MHIVWMIVIGLVVGAAAKLLMPGRDHGGLFATMLPVVTGSVVAGSAGRMFGFYQGPWEGAGFVTSILGAVVVLLLYRLLGTSLWSRIRKNRRARLGREQSSALLGGSEKKE